MVRLSRDRTGPQGFDRLIEKNYGSGLCQLEVEDLVAAFDDLARVELALRRNIKMQKKKMMMMMMKPTGAALTG